MNPAAAPADSTAGGAVLGFDYGTRLTGVAVGSRITGHAHALEVVPTRAGQPDWQRLDALIDEWHPQALIVGLPLTLAGGEQSTSVRARKFAKVLRQRHACPVHLIDERHSSQEAARRFAEQRAAGLKRRRDAGKIDALAAVVILETWLAECQ